MSGSLQAFRAKAAAEAQKKILAELDAKARAENAPAELALEAARHRTPLQEAITAGASNGPDPALEALEARRPSPRRS